MEMQQVRYFTALAQTLNFTRAAERCNVTQPALTRAIQGLEAELGGPLFHRERSRTHLSELGRMMLPYFESIQRQAQVAREAAVAFKRLERAQLKIGVMCTIGPAVLSAFFKKFCAAHPEIEIDVMDLEVKEVARRLLDGDLEIALFAQPEDLDVRFHGLPLFKEKFVAVLPPDHRLARLNVVPCRELDDEPYVNRANCEYDEFVGKRFALEGICIRKVFSSARDDWVLAMINAGLGFGFFPEFSAVDPDLVVRPLTDPEFERTVMLVTMRGRPHSPAVGAFVRQAKAEKWRSAS